MPASNRQHRMINLTVLTEIPHLACHKTRIKPKQRLTTVLVLAKETDVNPGFTRKPSIFHVDRASQGVTGLRVYFVNYAADGLAVTWLNPSLPWRITSSCAVDANCRRASRQAADSVRTARPRVSRVGVASHTPSEPSAAATSVWIPFCRRTAGRTKYPCRKSG